MRLVRDMVWAVLLSDALPRHDLQPDRVRVECGPNGIWLYEIGGRTLASLWREQWWAPPTLSTVEAIADFLAEQLGRGEEAPVHACAVPIAKAS